MSNEKFNELDLGLHAFDQFKEILARNDFGKMLDLMHPLTQQLSTAFGEFLKNLPENVVNAVNVATGGQPPPSGGGSLKPPFGVASFITPIITPNIQDELQPVQDVIDSQKTSTVKLNAVEQYASTWIDYKGKKTNFNYITLEQARYLLNEFSKGNLPNMLFARSILLKKWESLQPKILTPAEKSAKTITSINQTSSGLVQKIALAYEKVQRAMYELDTTIPKMRKQVSAMSNGRNKNLASTRVAVAIGKAKKEFLFQAKQYNQLVQMNRQPNLAIDTNKSLQQNRIVPK